MSSVTHPSRTSSVSPKPIRKLSTSVQKNPIQNHSRPQSQSVLQPQEIAQEIAQLSAALSLSTSKTPTMDTMTDDANDANDENDDWMDNFPPTFISDEFAMNSDQLKRLRQAMTDYNERNKSEYDISIDSNRLADAIKGLKEMVREGDAQIVVYQCKGNGAACPCE